MRNTRRNVRYQIGPYFISADELEELKTYGDVTAASIEEFIRKKHRDQHQKEKDTNHFTIINDRSHDSSSFDDNSHNTTTTSSMDNKKTSTNDNRGSNTETAIDDNNESSLNNNNNNHNNTNTSSIVNNDSSLMDENCRENVLFLPKGSIKFLNS